MRCYPSLQVPVDAFLLVCECAWGQLSPSDRRAFRATCRGGQLLHDRLLTRLRMQLCSPSRWSGPAAEERHSPPTPAELRKCIMGVLQRGSRLASLKLLYHPSKTDDHLPQQEREEQL